ncbi:MAG: tRNA 4-thiouridine(8) synthase ThiI [Candidatus Altiarchaeales archaeon ex4484_96]|nr:MAG: tRNA 4-thiouridine(8) synthase ThiI [Candidatus Altiarchaeales archaeon ex4484_96]
MYDTILIRYSEIYLKSEYVKNKFENQLIENIRLKINNPEAKIKKGRHRIYVKTKNIEKHTKSISKIYGIKSLSPVKETESEIKNLTQEVLKYASNVIKKENAFACRVSRSKDYPLKSKKIEEKLGAIILEHINCHVNLEHPDTTIYVEIRGKKAYIYDKIINGVGGLPYKTQGKLIALISEGIDSPIAAWMMMKRGCEIIALHYGSSQDYLKVLKKLEKYSVHEIKSILIPWDKTLMKIQEKAGKYTCVLCKRMMLRIAEEIALKEGAQGIITGENIGQAATQTIYNLRVIDEAVNLPVYRPLAGFDKQEIIEKARIIETYMLLKPGSCGYVPSKPSTRADIIKIKKIEQKLKPDELVNQLMKECEIK